MRPTRFHPSILCLVATMAAACASGAINPGVAVTALPAPDGDHDSGAAPLANWSLEIAGKRWAGTVVTLE